MEETYWKQFMTTGKVEDYLHFKEVSNIEGRVQKEKESGKFEGNSSVKTNHFADWS